MRRKHALLTLLLILVASSVWAAPEHFVLIRYSGPDPDKYRSSLVALVVGDSVGLRAVVSGLPADASDSDVAKEAKRFACDVVLTVTVAPDGDKDKITWSIASPDEKRPRASGTVTKPRPTWPLAADIFWVFLTEPLVKETGPDARVWPQPPVAEQAEFTVIGKPGTKITGLPAGAAIIDETGKLAVVLNLPVSISLEGHLELWVTKPVRVFVDHPDQQVVLDQKPVLPWSVDAAMNNFTFPSVGVSWRPWSRLTARFMLDQYMAGLLFSEPENDNGGLPVQSIPLMTLQLGAAWEWSWPEDAIRFYTGGDLGLRVMMPQYSRIAVEPIAPVSIWLFAGWEYHWEASQAVYFEVGPSLAWVVHEDEYLASIGEHTQNLNFKIPGTPFYTTIPVQAKAGYRWFF